jgi:hypothetical protein
MFLVLKPFGDAGFYRVAGEVVDGKDYKWLNKLIAQRYLISFDIKNEENKTIKCQLCERVFVKEEILNAHYILCHPNDITIVKE